MGEHVDGVAAKGMAPPIAEAKGVGVSFDEGGRSKVVLENVSLAVNAGEVVAVLGPSGCGKSTLMRVLIGLLKPTHGAVLANGRPLRDIHPGAAIVFQNFDLYPWLTVAENVAVAVNGLGLDRETAAARIEHCIDLVGMGGHEAAYPKELSGGMKQRVGIARALARGPELLCMDEPFSSLDVFTAESLRSEVYRLWTGGAGAGARLPGSLKSILIVTHLIEEAVFLADRIVIMGTHPGHVRQVVVNGVSHPREYQDPAFLSMVRQIHDVIISEHLPEPPPAVTETAPGGMPACEPLPAVHVGEIVGLVEILHDHGGRMDVFALDSLTDYDFGHTLSVIKAGEMLDLLDTPGNSVCLTDLGRRLVDADINGRKAIFREQLPKLGTFRLVARILEEAKDHRLPGDVVREELAMRLPMRDIEPVFKAIIRWGRFAELLGYDARAKTFHLEPRAAPVPGAS